MGGEKEENDEEGAEEENINEENKNEESVNESEKKNEEAQQPTNNAHLIKQIGPITIDSTPPEKPTRHRDVAESMRGSVLSRCPIVDCIFLTKPFFWGRVPRYPGTLEWKSRSRLLHLDQSQLHSLCEFSSITSLSFPNIILNVLWKKKICLQEIVFLMTFLNPPPRRPEKRRAPISVDHKLRKHALDFWRDSQTVKRSLGTVAARFYLKQPQSMFWTTTLLLSFLFHALCPWKRFQHPVGKLYEGPGPLWEL